MSQQPPKAAPTAAQLSVIHSLQSAGQAAGISIVVGIGQYLVTGNVNVSVLLTVLGSAFLGAGTMVYKSIAANPSLAQAALDTANEALQKIEQELPWMANDIAKLKQASISKQPTSVVPVPQPIVLQQPQPVRTNTPPAQTTGYSYQAAPQNTAGGVQQQAFNPSQSYSSYQQQNADFLTQGPPAQQSALSQLAQSQRPQGG